MPCYCMLHHVIACYVLYVGVYDVVLFLVCCVLLRVVLRGWVACRSVPSRSVAYPVVSLRSVGVGLFGDVMFMCMLLGCCCVVVCILRF